MALSIEEQRRLSEIAFRLGEDDPELAERLSTMGRTRQRRRFKIFVTVMVAGLLMAAVAAMVVMMS